PRFAFSLRLLCRVVRKQTVAGPSPYVPPLGTLADTLKAMGLLLAGPLGSIENFGTVLNVWLNGALGTLCFTLD
ncbi:hypothetical protein, partial [Collinsella aerofaciens]|uniref:hypothetical protein n=1 Tax=Collinsella aerofaciens TaxID=74426 RepID=UPI001C02D9F7